MENSENENPITGNKEPMEKDEIVNPEQFQVGRAPEEDKNENDDSEYTPQENEFADGKGTPLAEEFDAPEVESDEDETENELGE